MVMNYNNYHKGNKQGFVIENNLEQKEISAWILDENSMEGLPEEVTYVLKSRGWE